MKFGPIKHELGGVTPRSPLHGFTSSRTVLPAPAPPLLSHHCTPLALPTAAAPILSVSAPPERTPITAVATSAFPPAVLPPRVGTSPVPHTLILFHEQLSLWPYPRAPLDEGQGQSAQSSIHASEKSRTVIYWRAGNGTSVWQQVEVDPPIDLMPKSQSPAQRRLTARCSPSLRRALRSSRPYMATMAHSNGNRSLATTRTDRNEFVREVLTLIHVRCPPSPLFLYGPLFTFFFHSSLGSTR